MIFPVITLWEETRDGMRLSVYQYGMSPEEGKPETFKWSVHILERSFPSPMGKFFEDQFHLGVNGERHTRDEAEAAAQRWADRLKILVENAPKEP